MNQWVYERFGSKKGFFRFLYHRGLAFVGVYGKYTRGKTGYDPFQRIVFICSGNICRSPLAEVYARSLGMDAASCGLHCGTGFPADARVRKFAQGQGLSLENHKTMNVRDFEFKNSDLIVVMEPSHLHQFQKSVGKNHRLILAGNHCPNPSPYIHDPFNCSPVFFTRCGTKVMESVRGICA